MRRGGAIVEADARMLAARIERPGEHVGDDSAASSAHAGSCAVPTSTSPSTPRLDERARHAGFGHGDRIRGTRAAARTPLFERLLQRVGGPRVDRVVERRNDRAYRVGAARGERARRAVRDVTQAAHRPCMRAASPASTSGQRQRARHGRSRTLCAARATSRTLAFFFAVFKNSTLPAIKQRRA